MAKIKSRYVAKYAHVGKVTDVKAALDKLGELRLKRATSALNPTRYKKYERAIVYETRKIGDLIREYGLWSFINVPPPRMIHHEEIHESTKALGEAVLTHAHIDRNKNIVFTKEKRSLIGKEIIPTALNPTSWRWRMKVPIRNK